MSHTKSFIILLLATLFACTQNNITIVKNNQTDYEIVVPENADTTVVKAVHEFQYYIGKISGVQIPLTGETKADAKKNKVFIGSKSDETSSAHTILIKNDGKNIVITGGSSQSVLYAVD
jgi:hypothetical protein